MAGTRRRARIVALQVLFEQDVAHHDVEVTLRRHSEGQALSEESAAFAQCLVQGVQEHRQALDEHIRQAAPLWPFEQMAPIDRNILRLAIFEIFFHNETPLKAAINEAVELAKLFGSDNSARFVNGVLGTIVRTAGPSR